MGRRRAADAGDASLGRRAVVGGLLAGAGLIVAPSWLADALNASPAATAATPARRLAPPSPARRWTRREFGRSVLDREMVVWSGTVPGAVHRVLVVSGIHGYERITHPLAIAMLAVDVPQSVDCWVVPSANPDGWVAGSRRNAHGVDLNRNFSWRWRSSTGGPRPGSEPETRALMELVEQVRPSLTVWIHQPLGFVAAIGSTPVEFARPWADATGVPARVGMDQHGGSETWSNRIAGCPSILVEVETWSDAPTLVARHVAGWQALLGWMDARPA